MYVVRSVKYTNSDSAKDVKDVMLQASNNTLNAH